MTVPPTTVSAADVIRNFGLWQERALAGPITITHHGRARTVLSRPKPTPGCICARRRADRRREAPANASPPCATI